MEHKIGTDLSVGGGACANALEAENVKFYHLWRFEAYDPDGNIKWIVEEKNLVTNVGLNDILTQYWKGSSYTAAHYVGLIDGGTSPLPSYAAGDTELSKSWTELQSYLNSPDVRPTLTLGTVASQSVDNSASKAVFAMANASPNSISVAGAFISTESTKGGGSPIGTLICEANFTEGSKGLNNGDTLNVTCTLTASSA